MVPSFTKILVRNSVWDGKKSTNEVQFGSDAIPGTGSRSREKTEGIYPVIEGPSKIVQIREIVITWIEALTSRALVCRFNGLWRKLVDLHTWLEASQKPLLSQPFSIYPCARGFLWLISKTRDKSTMVEAGPWFWGCSSLFMQHWSPTFNPSTTSISIFPIGSNSQTCRYYCGMIHLYVQ